MNNTNKDNPVRKVIDDKLFSPVHDVIKPMANRKVEKYARNCDDVFDKTGVLTKNQTIPCAVKCLQDMMIDMSTTLASTLPTYWTSIELTLLDILVPSVKM